MQTSAAKIEVPEEQKTCARCHTVISETMDHEVTPDGTLCLSCAGSLRAERNRDAEEQGRGVNYPGALLGALLGGAVGVLAWWQITVWTNIAFGLVAILIGIAVGKGATLFAGGRSSRGVQVMSLIVAGVSFFYASYLVNRTFIQQALAQEGEESVLPILPDPALFVGVISIGFDAFNLLFLAIVLWEAWKLSGPAKVR